jgi:hypothetical protein
LSPLTFLKLGIANIFIWHPDYLTILGMLIIRLVWDSVLSFRPKRPLWTRSGEIYLQIRMTTIVFYR